MTFEQKKARAIALMDSKKMWRSNYAPPLLRILWRLGIRLPPLPFMPFWQVREMRGAEYVIISKGTLHGRDALELVFEDGSDAPFVIHMLSEQCDRLLPENNQGGGFVVTVWTRGGNQLRYPGKYRVVENLPDVSPWSEH